VYYFRAGKICTRAHDGSQFLPALLARFSTEYCGPKGTLYKEKVLQLVNGDPPRRAGHPGTVQDVRIL